MIDCVEQLSARKLVHRRMVSRIFVTKFLTALVTVLESLVGDQWSCFFDVITKADSLMSCFKTCEEAFLD